MDRIRGVKITKRQNNNGMAKILKMLVISTGVLGGYMHEPSAGDNQSDGINDALRMIQGYVNKYNTPYFDAQARDLSTIRHAAPSFAKNTCPPSYSAVAHTSLRTHITIIHKKGAGNGTGQFKALWRKDFDEEGFLFFNPKSVDAPRGPFAMKLAQLEQDDNSAAIYNAEIKCFNKKGTYISSEQSDNGIKKAALMRGVLSFANSAASFADHRKRDIIKVNNDIRDNGFFSDNRYKFRGKDFYKTYRMGGLQFTNIPVFVDVFQLPINTQEKPPYTTLVVLRLVGSNVLKVLISEIIKLQKEYKLAPENKKNDAKYKHIKERIYRLRHRLEVLMSYSLAQVYSNPATHSDNTIGYQNLYDLFDKGQLNVIFGEVPNSLKHFTVKGQKHTVRINTKMR